MLTLAVAFLQTTEFAYLVYTYLFWLEVIHLILFNQQFNQVFTDKERDKWKISAPGVCGWPRDLNLFFKYLL